MSFARQNLNFASKQLNDVEVALRKATNKLGIEAEPADRIAKRGRGRKKLVLLSAVVISSTLGFCYAVTKIFGIS